MAFGGSSVLMLSLFSYLLLIKCAAPFSFDFNPFKGVVKTDCRTGMKAACVAGDATWSADGVVNLVKSGNTSAAGWLYYTELFYLWDTTTGELASFSTSFGFKLDDIGYTDGIAFFMKPSTFEIPPANDIYHVLGLPYKQDVNNKFVAVEIDTNSNEASDCSFPHVGIDLNRLTSEKCVHIGGVNGPDYRMPPGNTKITYDATTKNLSVNLQLYDRYDTRSYSLWHIVDFKGILPQSVIIGLSASKTGSVGSINVSSWNFETTSQIPGRKNRKLWLSVGITASCLIVVGLISTLLWCRIRKKTKCPQELDVHTVDPSLEEEFGNEMGPRRFSYKDLAMATSNFSDERKLGAGGFGAVYKGFLRDMKIDVAIKVLSKNSKQGIKEYVSEVKTINRLRHRNLVQLVGWCHEDDHLLLVYEFMSNSSLDMHLFHAKSLLSWSTRYQITLGLASALHYLHEGWEECVVHRDVKSSNIMLDAEFNAKLGDFGLARLTKHGGRMQTTCVAGTMGYLAPECFLTGKGSIESDVYSYGVVSLEIACGRKCMEPDLEMNKIRLVDWVWSLHGKGRVLDAADERLDNDFDVDEMMQLLIVGLWCAHPDPKYRPSIEWVIRALKFETIIPELPRKMPTYAMPMTVGDFPAFESSSSSSKEPTSLTIDSCTNSTSYPSILVSSPKRTTAFSGR